MRPPPAGRIHGIAKADVHLIAQPRAAQGGVEVGAQAENRRLHPDWRNGDGLRLVRDSVLFNLQREEFLKVRAQTIGVDVHGSEEVDVARGARIGSQPMADEQRPL